MLQTATPNQTNQIALAEKLQEMLNGICVTQCIYIAAKLNIADLLKEGAKSSDELAKSTDVDGQSLYRVLRALSSIGIFTEGENRKFQLTPLAEYLQADIPGSMHAFAIFLSEHMQLPWGEILHSVKTGKLAFDKVYGMELPLYKKQNPDIANNFNQWMTDLTSLSIPPVLASYDFSPINKIVDVGGGHGLLITEILKANPRMRGILFDQPSVVEGAKDLIEAQGVAQRCEIEGGNFFESVPSGGDAYIMKLVMHGLNRERALTILKNCREAMAENAKLLLLEMVIPPANQPSISKWFDLHLFLMMGGGERTEIEHRELLAEAGFNLTKVVHTHSPIDVIEAVKA